MSNHYHTPISVGAPANANTINSPLGELDATLFDLVSGNLAWTQLNHGDPLEVTIANGEIDITQTYHTVDTEGDAASDILSTINGGQVGDTLILRIVSNSRTVTIDTGAGNIFISTGRDVQLTSTTMILTLFCLGTVWVDGFGGASSSSIVQLVGKTTLVGNQSSIQVASSLSPAYNVLWVFLELQDDRAATLDNVLMRFNADSTAANWYSGASSISNAGNSFSENLGTSAGILILNGATGASAPTGHRAVLQIEIYNYNSTNLYRHVSGDGFVAAADSANNQHMLRFGGTWKNNSAAISQIDLYPVTGTNFVAGSTYEVYGIL